MNDCRTVAQYEHSGRRVVSKFNMVNQRTELVMAVVIGVGAAGYCALAGALRQGGEWLTLRSTGGDFFQTWVMTRAIAAGANPYVVGCPSIPPCADSQQYYPLTAGIAAFPLGFIPAGAATVVFVGLSAGLLAYGIARSGMWRGSMLLSWPFLVAAGNGQWAPILVAAALLPGLQWLYPVKPQLGLALWLWRPSWRALALGALLVACSLLVRPAWPLHWWPVARASPYVKSPVLSFAWFAPVLLLAVLRWRTPEGRLLLAMAILPQTPFAYDQLALWLIPRTHRETLNLTWLSWAGFGAWLLIKFDWHTGNVRLTTWAPYVIAFLFLPCLVMVLRRPNVSPSSGQLRALPETSDLRSIATPEA